MKPAERFYRNRRNNSGLAYKCKDCENARTKERCRSRSKEYNKVVAALEEVSYEKVCKACGRLLACSAFSKSSTNVDYLRNDCRCCASRYNRKRAYGLSDEILDGMLAVETCQMPGCCNQLDWTNGTHIDHCHKTGKVRAVLCQRCNTLLGHIEKNMHLISPMLGYINKHKGDNEAA